MDRRAMIGHIAAKFNVKLDENDPAFLLVEMSQIALESAGQELETRLLDALDSRMKEFIPKIEEMNHAADNLVESKLIDLNNQVNSLVGVTIKNTIEQTLNVAVAKEIQAIRREVGVIGGSLQNMHIKSGQSQILAGAAAGAFAALLVIGIAWWGVSSGRLPIDVRVDSQSVAQTVLDGVRSLPKTR